MDKKTVLVADDEESIRQVIHRVLHNEYNVIEAAEGEEAIQMAQQFKPDLIFLDIMMPKKDGYAVCSEIKKNPETRSIPVIMLTGLSFELNKKLAERLGASGYITKPFATTELLDTVRRFI